MSRGFFGIGVYHPKREVNIGTLWRHAYLFGASFVFTIGHRYARQSSDTPNTPLQIPLYNYDTFESFRRHLPYACRVVCIEMADKATPLPKVHHPLQAAYLLGAEDHGLPEALLFGHQTIMVPTMLPYSMNVSTAGSIVMYDRFTKTIPDDA